MVKNKTIVASTPLGFLKICVWVALLLGLLPLSSDAFVPNKSRRSNQAVHDYYSSSKSSIASTPPVTTISNLYSTPTENDESGSDPLNLRDQKQSSSSNVGKVASSFTLTSTKPRATSSKRKMLGFAIPALGIFLCNPLLSNIDNAFVGKTVGTVGLAALSPATICTDQMLFFFSFLGRATTGLVSRAYAFDEASQEGDKKAAREAASPALSVSLLIGIVVTGFYALFTPNMLAALKVAPSLRAPAGTYIYWRGAIAWAALSQNVILNILLATRDAATPLKIVLLAAAMNVVGDALLCVWPLQMGCGGAAAATAFATLFSSFFMVRSLKRKDLLPKISIPTKKQLLELIDFTGPLLIITLIRLVGFINMQTTANRLGVNHMAAYQMAINIMFLFQLFGEPLSQLSQTQLPALVDSKVKRGPLIRATLQSILTLTAMTAMAIGGAAGLTLGFGTGMFSSDAAVQTLAKGVAPWLFAAVTAGIFSVAVDGAMVASRDFGFMIFLGTVNLLIQGRLLASSWCTSVSAVFATFTLRLVIYALGGFLRAALGFGPLGKALRRKEVNDADEQVNGASSVPIA